MQEKHVYPHRKLYLSLMDVMSKCGHTALIVEVLVPCIYTSCYFVSVPVIGTLLFIILLLINFLHVMFSFFLLNNPSKNNTPRNIPLQEVRLKPAAKIRASDKLWKKVQFCWIFRDKFTENMSDFAGNFAEMFRTNFAEKRLVNNCQFHGTSLDQFRWKAIGFALI